MSDLAKAPDLGAGPYGVEHDVDDGFFHITLDGQRTDRIYPLGKTAYRECRKLNEAFAVEHGLAFPKLGPAEVDLVHKPPQTRSREDWLNAFIAAARPVFGSRGLILPEKIRVSIGFTGARGKGVLAVCWHEGASEDGTREIFIHPGLSESSRIADILTHELAHTLFGPDEQHGRNFKAAVTALGLVGKATCTTGGPEWHVWAGPIVEALGPIPHSSLDPTLSPARRNRALGSSRWNARIVASPSARQPNG